MRHSGNAAAERDWASETCSGRKVPEEEAPELFDATGEVAWDDVSGKYLDADKVKQARASEMD